MRRVAAEIVDAPGFAVRRHRTLRNRRRRRQRHQPAGHRCALRGQFRGVAERQHHLPVDGRSIRSGCAGVPFTIGSLVGRWPASWGRSILRARGGRSSRGLRIRRALDPVRTVHDLCGAPVDVEVLATDPWSARTLLVDRYAGRRIFLVGDAAHLNPPWGGHGFNTCVGDAVNLAWKIAAVLRGHAGARLLDSYEIERRPVAQQTLDAAGAQEASWHRRSRQPVSTTTRSEGRRSRTGRAGHPRGETFRVLQSRSRARVRLPAVAYRLARAAHGRCGLEL